MIKILYIIFLSLIVANCSFKKVVEHHGVPFLEKKQTLLKVNETNTNDIKEILGNPSTTSKFDNDIWIYIENKSTKSSLIKLGKTKYIKNNVLVLEINNKGLLVKKKLYTINDVNNIKYSEQTTQSTDKDTFVYGFLSSIKQKIDSPKKRRSKKR